MFQIPAQVYILFCALIYLGVRRCFPRTVRPERTLVFPLSFAAWGALAGMPLGRSANVLMRAANAKRQDIAAPTWE